MLEVYSAGTNPADQVKPNAVKAMEEVVREDWGLDDPVSKPMNIFRETRDVIEGKVKELIEKAREGNI
nr:hypothetical protein [Halocella sp. SP3-1]